MKKLRILLADDHEIVRRGLVAIVKAHSDWQVCAECDNGIDAVKRARELKPDIAILDIGMPMLNGFETTRQILRDNPEVKVLILTLNDSAEIIRVVLNEGARGFILKSDAARDLISAVEALQQNRTFFTSRVSHLVLDGYLGKASMVEVKFSTRGLTAREREIVQLLAEGKSSKEVACVLNLSVKTAETHRSNIMRKLVVHSVSELVLYAVRNNMVQVTPFLAQSKAQGTHETLLAREAERGSPYQEVSLSTSSE